jgi:hypothetical protein
MGALQLLTWQEWDIIMKIGYIREGSDATATSWGNEWIALEKIKTGTALQAHCESYQEAVSSSATRSKVQDLDLGSICRVQADISSCEILEEEVFLVEISVKDNKGHTIDPC